jgi:hypothetical protein
MTSIITRTETGYFVRVEGGSCSGTYAQCVEFLAWVGLTPEMKEFEAAFEGGGMGTGF